MIPQHADRQEPLRVLLYSHDTFGLGHLRRNLVIADRLLSRRGKFAVTLVTGSPVATTWPLPGGLQLRQMPPVVKTGPDTYAARDQSMTFAEVKSLRERIILAAIADFQPDVMLVDHAPSGMKGELLPALARLRQQMPRSRIVLGLRDILDDGETVCHQWTREGTYDLIREFYDRILVYGTQDFFDVATQYRMPAEITARIVYCGHVARTMGAIGSEPLCSARTSRGKAVLVTVGGGGDGFNVIMSYLKALEKARLIPDQSIIVTGPLMPEQQRRTLETFVEPGRNVVLETSTHEMARLQSNADIIVGMAGYNSSVEILAANKPAILIPRTYPRFEQRIRAQILSEMGLVWVVEPDDTIVDRLSALLADALSGKSPPALRQAKITMDGADRIASVLDSMSNFGEVGFEHGQA